MIVLAVACIIGFGFFVQAAFGFGGGLISIPLMTLLIGGKAAVTVAMVFQFLIGMQLYWLRRDIDRKIFFRLVPGLVAGLGVGMLAFSAVDDRYVSAILAAYIALYVLRRFVKLPRIAPPVPVKAKPYVAGFFGGLVQGIAGTGGPAIVPYLKDNTGSVIVFRATVAASLFFLCALRIVFAGAMDMMDQALIPYILASLPFFAVAQIAGYRAPRLVTPETAYRIMDLILLGAAVSIFAKLAF